MPIFDGTTPITQVFLGSTEITEIRLGSNPVFPDSVGGFLITDFSVSPTSLTNNGGLITWTVTGAEGATYDFTGDPGSGSVTIDSTGTQTHTFTSPATSAPGQGGRTSSLTITPTGVTTLDDGVPSTLSVGQPGGPALLNPRVSINSFSWNATSGAISISASWDGPGQGRPVSFVFRDSMGNSIIGSGGNVDATFRSSPGSWNFTAPSNAEAWDLQVSVQQSGAYRSGSAIHGAVSRGDSF